LIVLSNFAGLKYKRKTFNMKRTATLFVFLMMVIGTAMAQRVIKNPEVDYTPFWLHIDEIRLDKDATVVKGEMQNQPNWWCRVDSTDFLIDPATNKKYSRGDFVDP
jgi:hypothetical protein